MNNQYTDMINNLTNLFQYDADKAINFTYKYRDRILINTNEINKQVYCELNKNLK